MMPNLEWNIGRDGRAWSAGEIDTKYHRLCPARIELIEGKLFWSDDDRLTMLALLLENVGADKAVRLGSPSVWREAVSALPE